MRHRRRNDLWLPRLKPQRDAARLLAALKERGFTLVAASSAKRQELQPLLEIAGGARLMDEKTSSDNADESKPEPDIVHAALGLARVRPSEAVMIGDTPYDVEAAARAGVGTIAFRCGGWSDEASARPSLSTTVRGTSDPGTPPP